MQTKEERAAYMRGWRKDHREQRREDKHKWVMEHPEQVRKYAHKRYGKIALFIQQQKTGKQCALCGEADVTKLCFHHRDPATKSFSLSGAGNKASIERIMEEIAKCVVWCRACHQAYHMKKRGPKDHGN
jgi:hypothetical protein